MAIFSNPLFATYSVYARNASVVKIPHRDLSITTGVILLTDRQTNTQTHRQTLANNPAFISTSAKEVAFSSAFVCLLLLTHKLLDQFLQNSVKRWPQKKILDSVGHLDLDTLRVRVTVR